MPGSNDKVEENAQRAEHFAPTHVFRLTQHYHNLIYIKNYWESIGQQCPAWVISELTRADTEIRELLANEAERGGFLHARGANPERTKVY